VIDVLNLLGISKVSLMSNNPGKVTALTDASIDVVEHPIHIAATSHSREYLKSKQKNMGHSLHESLGNGSAHAMVIMMLRELLPRLRPEHMEELEKIVNGTNIPADPLLIREP
jgi:hypothetical protein